MGLGIKYFYRCCYESGRHYQAMDIFVMPSLYEGFPIAAVEAQCAGLPMVLSTQITDEADIMCELNGQILIV